MEDNIDAQVPDKDVENEVGDAQNLENEVKQNLDTNDSSAYLTASELLSLRKEIAKNKGKDPEFDISKGLKLYIPTDSAEEKEVLNGMLEKYSRSLKLERCAKIRDLIKAEWNEELKVVFVDSLKGKITQHMGHNVKGRIALTPQEALYLLEKSYIEIIHNNMPMSIEEAYSVMLKEKFSLEKYQVYSLLSQQGFIVVHHQKKIGPSCSQVKNLLRTSNKRKAVKPIEEAPPKRLTFTGVLSSNSELTSSVSTESNKEFNDTDMINIAEPASDIQVTPQQDSSNCENIDNLQFGDEKQDSSDMQNITVSSFPTSTVENDKDETTEKESSLSSKVQLNIDEGASNDHSVHNEVNFVQNEKSASEITMTEHVSENSNILNHESEIIDKDSTVGKEEENTVMNEAKEKESDKQNVAARENNFEEDTGDVIIEDVYQNEKEHVNNTLNDNGSSDHCFPVLCEDTNDDTSAEVDVLSCSTGDEQNFENSSNEFLEEESVHNDDEVTLVEVKKKETTPLAVIDLLSDDESDNAPDEEYEASDDEIQIVKVCAAPNAKNNKAEESARKAKAIKMECKKEAGNTPIKPAYKPVMNFPDLFRKDVLCLPRPPATLLPNHVRPAKEAYIVNLPKSSQPRQGRLWNSFRDLQEYQREKRREKANQNSNRQFGSPNMNFQNNSFSNQGSPFNRQDNRGEMGFDRNNRGEMGFDRNNRGEMGFDRNNRALLSAPLPNNNEQPSPWLNPRAMFANSAMFNSSPFMLGSQNFQTPNPFVNELQKTVYSLATNMLSNFLGQNFNPNNSHPLPMNFNQYQHINDVVPPPSDQLPPFVNRNDVPTQFPPEPFFNGPRYSPLPNETPSFRNSFPTFRSNFRRRNTPKGPAFPCSYRAIRQKRSWSDVKAAIEGKNTSKDTPDSDSDIEEVPINLNSLLWSKDIEPLVRPGSKLPESEVLKSLQITQMAKLQVGCNDKYLPSSPSLEISFDVYLPGSKYKKTAPDIPKYRVVVVRSIDPIPKYSEIVFLQKKWNDGATLQMAIVDHGDISFYSFNNVNIPELIPFKN